MEPNIQIHQTQKHGAVRAVDYRTYWIGFLSPCYEDSMSHYIPEIVEMLRLLMKIHTCYLASPDQIINFLTIFKLACDASRIRIGTATLAMPIFVANSVVSAFNSCMVQSNGTKGLATLISSNGTALEAPRLRSYSEVVSHLPKRYANDEATA